MSKLNQDDSSPHGFAPGTVIDNRYKVVRSVGEGGNGLVHEVEHLRTGRRLALKTLLDETGFARLEQEARATSLLRNEHAARITDMGTAGSAGPYLVMELLDGQSLRALLDDAGQLPLELTANIALEVCECLAEAHGHGIVHRDLKPENVFLCPSPWPGQYDVKVLDFGVVKIASDGPIPNSSLTRTGSTVGTPYYMSLEQLRNSSNVDARADVYSLGVVLYESLCGRKPFQADTIGDLVYALCSGPPTHLGRLRPDLPADVCDVLMRCLHMSRDERPGSMVDLAMALLPHGSPAFGLWIKVDGKRPAALPRAGAGGVSTPSSMKSPPVLDARARPQEPPGVPPRAPLREVPRPAVPQGAPFAPTPSARTSLRHPYPTMPLGGAAGAKPTSAELPSGAFAPPAAPGEEDDDSDQATGQRRDTPTEMYVKAAHGSIDGPEPGRRDTPTSAFVADGPMDLPTQMPAAMAGRSRFLETLKSPHVSMPSEEEAASLAVTTPQLPGSPPSAPVFGPKGTLPLGARFGQLGVNAGGMLGDDMASGVSAVIMPPGSSAVRHPGDVESPTRSAGMLATAPVPVPDDLRAALHVGARPGWQQWLDGALVRVGAAVEGMARSFRAAPVGTQVLLAVGVGLPLLAFAVSMIYLLSRR